MTIIPRNSCYSDGWIPTLSLANLANLVTWPQEIMFSPMRAVPGPRRLVPVPEKWLYIYAWIALNILDSRFFFSLHPHLLLLL